MTIGDLLNEGHYLALKVDRQREKKHEKTNYYH